MRLSPVTLPLAFRRAQAADLTGWTGEPDHPGLANLITSMEATLGRRRLAAPAIAAPAAPAGAPPPATDAEPAAPDRTPAPTHVPAGRPPTTATGHDPSTAGGEGRGRLIDRVWPPGDPARRRVTFLAAAGAAAVLLVAFLASTLLGGAGRGPSLSVDRPKLTLEVRAGEEALGSLELTNDGDRPTGALRANVVSAGAAGDEFSVDDRACNAPLDVAERCILTVGFDARASASPATVLAYLIVTGAGGEVRVDLTGMITGTRAFVVEPESTDLKNAVAGDRFEIDVSNRGDLPLTLVVTLDDANFALEEACGDPIAVGERCTVIVTVTTATFEREHAVHSDLAFSAPGLLEQRVALSAESTADDAARIRDIAVSGSAYAVRFETYGYQAALPGEHVHFFFNSVPPSQAGVPGDGPWFVYGGTSPFTGYGPADRPSSATELCILVANPDHSVQAGTGNCMTLP